MHKSVLVAQTKAFVICNISFVYARVVLYGYIFAQDRSSTHILKHAHTSTTTTHAYMAGPRIPPPTPPMCAPVNGYVFVSTRIEI